MAVDIAPISPRCLSKDQASAYCGISPRTFDDRVRSGVYPKSLPNTNQWDKVAIDRAIDKLSGFDQAQPLTPEEQLEAFKAERAARKAAEKAAREREEAANLNIKRPQRSSHPPNP